MRLDVRMMTRTAIPLGLVLAFQSMGLAQPITGPVINAVLFVTTAVTGTLSGLLIGSVTPWVAYITGLMKIAPAVPVIMLGNLSLVVVFALLSRFNRYVAAVIASVTKWLVMTAGVKYIVAPQIKIPAPAYVSLTIMQLWTALGGALLGLLVIASLTARNRRSKSA